MRSASTGSRAASPPPPSIENRPCGGEAGFTLLETLTALTILAIALVSLYHAQARGVRAASAVGAYAEARLLAQALLAETQAPRGRAPVSRRGREGRFTWSVETVPEQAAWAQIASKPKSDSEPDTLSQSQPEAEPPTAWQMHRIHVRVGWDRNRSVDLQTLKLGPVRE